MWLRVSSAHMRRDRRRQAAVVPQTPRRTCQGSGQGNARNACAGHREDRKEGLGYGRHGPWWIMAACIRGKRESVPHLRARAPVCGWCSVRPQGVSYSAWEGNGVFVSVQ